MTEGSAGEKAGIRKGDVVTKFDGESVIDKEDLVDKLSYYAVGETVTLEVQTANGGDYEEREVEVTLQEGTDIPDDDGIEIEVEEDPKDEESQESPDDSAQEPQSENGFWFDGFGVPGGNDGEFFPFSDGENDTF